jgi:hypothetical protein
VGGSSEGIGEAPTSRAGAAAWRRANQARYDNDEEFRAAVDAVTLLTQSSTHDIRAASIAAAGHEEDLRAHYQDKLDEPLSTAANPLASYKNYFTGQDVEHADYVTVREAGAALNRAIDTAPRLEEPIFRGMMAGSTVALGPGMKIDPVSGRPTIVDEKAYQAERERLRLDFSGPLRKDPPNPLLTQLDKLKAGDDFKMPGATSFTADKFIAQQFSRGEARGQGGGRSSGPRYHSAILIEARDARGIPVAALSPWNQQEVITRGQFKVESVTKTPYRGSIYDYHVVLRAK